MPRRIVILADESASWKIAGLRQVDRLLLAVNESASRREETVEVFLDWPPDFPRHQRSSISKTRLTRLHLMTARPALADILLSTRLFPWRDLWSAFATASPISLDRSFAQLTAEARAAAATHGFEYLTSSDQIPDCERRFLRGSGKPQDGLVSQYLNRPISRAISRLLLKTAITPNGWTLMIFILPLLGAGLLAQGNYAGLVTGMLLFQLYSILDGCDGEIARAKYLRSARGARLDTWCDIIGTLLLVISLGFGLSRQRSSYGWLIEGVIVALLILSNEFLLAGSGGDRRPGLEKTNDALYPRHRRLFGASNWAERGAGRWLIQLTKRDVSVVLFLLLALAGWPGWILHLLGLVAAGTLLLALRNR